MTPEELDQILEEIDCQPYFFRRGFLDANNEVMYVQVCRERIDTITGDVGEGRGAKLFVSAHSVRNEVIQKVLAGCLAFAEHETREAFRWRGVRVFGPHIATESLLEAARHVEHRPAPTQEVT